MQSAKTSLQSLVSIKNDFITEVQKQVRDVSAIIKRNPNYTESIGKDIGIISAGSLPKSEILANAKPFFEATVLPDKVRLDWVKGEFDGVSIECKRGDESAFTKLGIDTKSPFDDKRESLIEDKPETREYRMRYIINDEDVGMWSDVVKVVCLI